MLFGSPIALPACPLEKIISALCPGETNKYTFRIHTSLTEAQYAWKTWLPQKHPLLASHLVIANELYEKNVHPVYCTVYTDATPTMAMYCQHIRINTDYINMGMLRHLPALFFKKALAVKNFSLLVAGNIFLNDFDGVYFRPTISCTEKKDIWQETIHYLQSQKVFSAVLIKDTTLDFDFEDLGYSLQPDVNMELEIHQSWTDISDYTSAITRKYKTRFRKVRSGLDTLTVRLLSTQEVGHLQERMHTLYKDMSNRQLFQFSSLQSGYFTAMKSQMSDSFEVTGFFLGNKLLGFYSAFVNTDCYDVHYAGVDYSFNETHSLYFNILFSCLERAILLKKKKLLLGRTALDAKAVLGCKPRYMPTYLRFSDPIARIAHAQFIKANPNSEGQWATRSPFKNDSKHPVA